MAADSHLPRNPDELETSTIAQAVADAHRMNRSEALAYTCYSDSSTRGLPVNRMNGYINKTVMAGPPADGRLYTIQALWQETVASVTVGELHGSTLLDDESRSALNQMVTNFVSNQVIETKRLNMVEINNVCDGGADLLAALRQIP